MRILLSNDDGYFAPGLEQLAAALAPRAEITVVAPERDRSGASNSLTLDRPLSVRRAPNGFLFVNGTPTDCVHLAVTGLLDQLPDMVISGVNLGANMGDDTIYSPFRSPRRRRAISKRRHRLRLISSSAMRAALPVRGFSTSTFPMSPVTISTASRSRGSVAAIAPKT